MQLAISEPAAEALKEVIQEHGFRSAPRQRCALGSRVLVVVARPTSA